MSQTKEPSRVESRMTSAEAPDHALEELPFEMFAIGWYERGPCSPQRKLVPSSLPKVVRAAASDHDEEAVDSRRRIFEGAHVVHHGLVDHVVEVRRLQPIARSEMPAQTAQEFWIRYGRRIGASGPTRNHESKLPGKGPVNLNRCNSRVRNDSR